MEVDRRDGQSYLALLGGNKRIHGKLLDTDGKAYGVYVCLRVTDNPVYVKHHNPITFMEEMCWCHQYKVSKRQYDSPYWKEIFFYEKVDINEEKERQQKALEYAMSIV